MTFTGTVEDDASVIDVVAFQVTDDYGRVQPSGITTVSGGRFTITVDLEASRRGGDTSGRRYVMLVTAANAAGHRASATAIAVVPHDRR